MTIINRFLIFFLLIALLYALYRYQQQMINSNNFDNRKKKIQQSNKQSNKYSNKQTIKQTDKRIENKKKKNKYPIIDDHTSSSDNISQLSVEPLNDIKSYDDDHAGYKQDSILNSLGSYDSLSFLESKEDKSKEQSIYLQKE